MSESLGVMSMSTVLIVPRPSQVCTHVKCSRLYTFKSVVYTSIKLSFKNSPQISRINEKMHCNANFQGRHLDYLGSQILSLSQDLVPVSRQVPQCTSAHTPVVANLWRAGRRGLYHCKL